MANLSEKKSAPHIALIAVQFFFGTGPVVGKVVLKVIPAVGLVSFRVGITAVVLMIVQLLRQRFWLKEKTDYWRLAVLSLFGVTFNQLFFVTGLSLTKASNTSLLAVTIPIFAMAVGAIAGTEQLKGTKVIGILLAAIGVVLIIDPRNASFSSETTRGDLLIIINSLCYGIYVATSKTVVTRNGALRSMMWVFIFAAIICIPLGAYSLSSIEMFSVEPMIWLLVAYIAIGVTTAPYLLTAWAIARVNPSTVAVYIYLYPLIGFLLAVIFLGEHIDLKFILATLLIFGGVYLVTKKFVPLET
jgi:drug/metabolite transporter (DMT)-like permease